MGIWLVVNGLSVTLQFIATILFEFGRSNSDDLWISLVYIVALLASYAVILRLFVFKNVLLIKVLQLEKGFENDKVDLDLRLKPILFVSIVVFGGVLFIDSFPLFCKQLFVFFQQKAIFRENPSSGLIILELVKTVISIFLITNGKYFATLLSRKATDAEEANDA